MKKNNKSHEKLIDPLTNKFLAFHFNLNLEVIGRSFQVSNTIRWI